MDAYVYLRIEPGSMTTVLAGLASKSGVRRAIAVVGDWDVLAHVEGPDLSTIAVQVLSEFHHVDRGSSAPSRRRSSLPIAWGSPAGGHRRPPRSSATPATSTSRPQAGAAGGIAERLGEMSDVSGVAVLGGPYDLMACVAQPWEVASGVVLEEIHSLPGVISTNTLVSVIYEEPEEDRDQFSAWT